MARTASELRTATVSASRMYAPSVIPSNLSKEQIEALKKQRYNDFIDKYAELFDPSKNPPVKPAKVMAEKIKAMKMEKAKGLTPALSRMRRVIGYRR